MVQETRHEKCVLYFRLHLLLWEGYLPMAIQNPDEQQLNALFVLQIADISSVLLHLDFTFNETRKTGLKKWFQKQKKGYCSSRMYKKISISFSPRQSEADRLRNRWLVKKDNTSKRSMHRHFLRKNCENIQQ